MANLLNQYKILVEFLGNILGPDYEIVLQDLSQKSHSIVAIKNGQISGRKPGGPLTTAAFEMISDKVYEKTDFLCNYRGIAQNGHILRSSTMFIKDDGGIPIGLLCINFDDSRYNELHERLLKLIHPEEFITNVSAPSNSLTEIKNNGTGKKISSDITENYAIDVPSLRQKIFEDATAHLTTPIDRLNQNERKEILIQLNEQGLFQLKGAISFVAKRFSCSPATIYRYLSEITS